MMNNLDVPSRRKVMAQPQMYWTMTFEVIMIAEQFVYKRTRTYRHGPYCNCLYPSAASSSDSLISASHQAGTRQ